MKPLRIILITVTIAVAFFWLGYAINTRHYSPLDTYVNTEIEKAQEETKALREAIEFINRPCQYEGAECPHVLEHRAELDGHLCRWDECPYTGTPAGKREEAVKKYTDCEEGSDCYYIDLLHLEFPGENYDQLQDRLFTAN